VDLVRSIGADRVIDYTLEDFTKTGDRYDLILDNVANHSLSDCRRALTAEGTYILNSDGGGLRRIVFALVLSRFVRQSLLTFITRPNHEDLVFLSELIEAGKLKSVIDRTYPLSQTPEAIAYLETKRARGKVIITVSSQ
jgi:NADPH:quinone reductase-like Zn-dependent oxidoreductase